MRGIGSLRFVNPEIVEKGGGEWESSMLIGLVRQRSRRVRFEDEVEEVQRGRRVLGERPWICCAMEGCAGSSRIEPI